MLRLFQRNGTHAVEIGGAHLRNGPRSGDG